LPPHIVVHIDVIALEISRNLDTIFIELAKVTITIGTKDIQVELTKLRFGPMDDLVMRVLTHDVASKRFGNNVCLDKIGA
jgi:hypothetical protein